jgi:hypothetical protein
MEAMNELIHLQVHYYCVLALLSTISIDISAPIPFRCCCYPTVCRKALGSVAAQTVFARFSMANNDPIDKMAEGV